MFGCILTRMIFWELVKVFVLCLIAITGILLMAGIVAEASQQGLNPAQIVAVIPLLIPSTLPYTIPATTLFATCIVYGRLSADNEILAIRASGINLTKVVGPAILIGLLTSAATMGLYYRLIPHTHHLMRSLFLADVEELLYSLLRKNSQLTHPQFDYSMFVKGVQGRRLISPTFKHRDTHGETDVAAQAQEAELFVDMKEHLLKVRMYRGWTWSKNKTQGYFEQNDWDVELPEDLIRQHRRPRDLTWKEIGERIDELEEEKEALAGRVEESRSRRGRKDSPDDLDKHIANLQNKIKERNNQVLAMQAELQMRPALSLGCLFFVLVGCPVGIWLSRSDYLSSFITCFLPIVFIYYPLMLCGTGIAKDGKFATIGTVWIADAAIGLAGLVLFRRLLRN
ncbi:MAG: LptF/LptG family permease [Planctomycetes bacterium]|nr:LptF/LptG family permease [Planctomycetota bacterium]